MTPFTGLLCIHVLTDLLRYMIRFNRITWTALQRLAEHIHVTTFGYRHDSSP
jgi:hypothetical protein